jgi:2-methylcitrate dehydratase PrpD
MGEIFSIMDVYFKPYTACRHTHGAAQSVIELVSEHAIKPEAVDIIEVHTYGIAELAVGKPFKPNGSFVSAQFSIPFVVAVCLSEGELGPAQLTEEKLRDPHVSALANKVTVRTDEVLNREYPGKTATRVEITLKDGSRFSRQTDIPRGDPRDPLEAEDLAEKIKNYAVFQNPERIGRIISMVLDLEGLSEIKALTALI